MADQRQYNLNVTDQCDGTTVVLETLSWVPGANNQADPANVRYRTVTTDLAGLLPPGILGRDGRSPALARVWVDRLTAGDSVSVIGSSDATLANPPSVTRQSALLTYSSKDATILELGMTDQIQLNTATATMVHVEVLDMDEVQLAAYLLAKFRNDAEVPPRQTEISVTSSQNIPGVPGHLIVNVGTAAGILVLPTLSPASTVLSPGDRVTFFYNGSAPAGQPVQIQTFSASDTVNGVASTVADTNYFLRDPGDSVSYLVTANRNWQRLFGEQGTAETEPAVSPYVVYVPKGGLGFNRDESTGLDNVGTLPDITAASAKVPTAAGTIVLNSDTLRHKVTPFAGQNINGRAQWYVQPGSAALFFAVQSALEPASWRAFGGGNQGRASAPSATDPITLTVDDISGGIATIETTGGAGQIIALPVVANVAPGSMGVFFNSSGNAHSVSPNGTDKINNVNAAAALAAGKRMIVIATRNGWVTILTA
jgi:hypothetical protein